MTIEVILTIIGTAVAVAGITISGISIMLKRAKKNGVDENRLKTVEDRVHDLPCVRHNDDISQIRSDVEYMRGVLSVKRVLSITGYAESHSPMALSQKGIELVNESGIKEMLINNWDKIKSQLDAMNLSTAYDIDAFCLDRAISSPDDFFTESDLVKLKGFAFNRGENLYSYAVIIGIIVRDRYIEEKGLSVSDIDNNSQTE